MLGKQNKFQHVFKAQYLPIVAVVAVEHVCWGIFFVQFAFHHFQCHEKLTLIAFSYINFYL